MKRIVLVAIVVVSALSFVVASAATLPVSSARMTVLTAPITPVSGITLALVNGTGGTAGRIDTGDRIVITFSRAIDVSTLCSQAVANPTTVQSINTDNAAVVTATNGGTSADTLTVTTPGACNGAFNLGTISTGSTAIMTSGSNTFSGSGTGRTTITYDPATFTLTIVLGSRSGSGARGVAGSSTAVYTPHSALEWLDGTSVRPTTGSVTGVPL